MALLFFLIFFITSLAYTSTPLYKITGLAAVVCHSKGDINHVSQRGNVNNTLVSVIILSVLHVMSNSIPNREALAVVSQMYN